MNKPVAFLVVVALTVLCAYRGSQSNATTTTPTATPISGRTFVDLLESQLVLIHYRSIVTRDGEALTVRIGAASAPTVRRAICRQGGWPGVDRIVRLDETLRRLNQEGVTKLKIVSDSETLDVQINQQGKCERGNV
ncbi:MAG: hypothetical protein ABI977_12615 [Acidobacteriota bacterium]